MYGQDKIEGIFGRAVGMIEAGASKDMIAAIDIENGWVLENCKLLIIATDASGVAGLLYRSGGFVDKWKFGKEVGGNGANQLG